ncbi:MAG: lytic transglycosylase domain-containing protein [Gammaproteobacteria bacterium]
MIRRLATSALIAIVLLVATTGNASARSAPGLESAWRNYMNNDTDIPPSYTFPHAHCFSRSASAHGLPPTLLLAVARGESDFEATAKSSANALGVMQILWPTTANHLGLYRLSQVYDPCTNIDAGARYLKELLARYDGNAHLALAAYNYGPQRIAKNGTNIPSGAEWYSGYIYRHLEYVLGDRARATPIANQLYSDLGRTTVVSFAEPYRAEAFIEQIEAHAPDLNLDWFRRDVGQFVVVLSYRDRDEFTKSARMLQNAGFPLE